MKKLLNKISASAFAAVGSFVPAAVIAVEQEDRGVPTDLDPVSPPANLEVSSLLVTVILWVLGFSAAVAVLFLILGGLQFVTSAGNADRVSKAKQTILYSVIGIIVIVLAYVIVVFINNNLQSAVK